MTREKTIHDEIVAWVEWLVGEKRADEQADQSDGQRCVRWSR